MKDKNTVVVTGASGFIGSNLVRLLKGMNYKVIGITKTMTNTIPDLIITFEEFIQDSYNPSIFDDVLCVFNIANTYDSSHKNSISQDILNSNLILPLKLAEIFATKSIPIVLPGSYLQNQKIFHNNNKISLYISMKNYVETVYNDHSQNMGLEYIRTRQYESYGKGDSRPRLLNRLVSQLKSGSIISNISYDFELDYIHVLDLCRGYIKILKQIEAHRFNSGEIIVLSSRKYLKYSELLFLIEDILKINFVHENGILAFKSEEVIRLSETAPWLPGWKPEIELKTGLSEMFQKI
jgi:nucleoside-diphosphate-sugar epimerase